MDEATTSTPLALFMARMHRLKARLAAGADPLAIDFEVNVEVRKFLNVAGIPLPSNAFQWAGSDVLDGGDPTYFNRRRRQRPALTSRQLLIGNVAHLVETLVAGDVFRVAAAARLVAAELNAAGFRPAKRGAPPFTARAVEEWHAAVVHKGNATDPAWDLYDGQQKVLQRTHPEHKQWGAARLKKWLADSVRVMARIAFFGKPG
jgi:hypothetical protein